MFEGPISAVQKNHSEHSNYQFGVQTEELEDIKMRVKKIKAKCHQVQLQGG